MIKYIIIIWKLLIKKINNLRKILIEKKLAHIKIISQDEIVPKKLKLYLSRHQEIEKNLSKNKTVKILVTETTPNINKLSKKWFGLKKDPEVIKI